MGSCRAVLLGIHTDENNTASLVVDHTAVHTGSGERNGSCDLDRYEPRIRIQRSMVDSVGRIYARSVAGMDQLVRTPCLRLRIPPPPPCTRFKHFRSHSIRCHRSLAHQSVYLRSIHDTDLFDGRFDVGRRLFVRQ